MTDAEAKAFAGPAPGPGLFVTGTDTGVGKTVVTAALARLLRRRGGQVVVCKPVATGAARVGGRLMSGDAVLLAEAAGGGDSPEVVTPWVFPDPLAPTLAARRLGVTLRLEELAGAVRRRRLGRRPGALLLVEGVGGLLCPLTEEGTVADLARLLGLPLVVVARNALGTLNHTLMTLEVAARRGLPVAGVVVSESAPPDDLAAATNVEELRRLGVPVLAVVPHLGHDGCAVAGARDEAAQALAGVPWERLAMAFAGLSGGEGQGT